VLVTNETLSEIEKKRGITNAKDVFPETGDFQNMERGLAGLAHSRFSECAERQNSKQL